MTEPPAAQPGRRKFLTGQWRYLAMMNYAVDPAILQPLTPQGVQLDSFDGVTYASMVGFMFLNTRLLGVPMPFHRNFEEVNLRFYVRREVEGEVRRGVVFIKEIVPRWAIACTARATYNEQYIALPMKHEVTGFDDSATAPPTAAYSWRLNKQWNSMRIQATGDPQPLVDGSVEEFITEHYWGYCAQRDGGTIEYQVEHPRWNVWQCADATLDCDIATLYGEAFVNVLQEPPVSSLLADGSEIAVYKPTRIA